MNKSTLIATCLVNATSFSNIDDAKSAVKNKFKTFFPKHNFNAWDGQVPNEVVAQCIEQSHHADTINVKKFITDLGF